MLGFFGQVLALSLNQGTARAVSNRKHGTSDAGSSALLVPGGCGKVQPATDLTAKMIKRHWGFLVQQLLRYRLKQKRRQWKGSVS